MIKQRFIKAISGVALSAFVFSTLAMSVFAAGTGTVTVDNAKVRSDASTGASTVTTVSQGSTVSVLDQKTDDSGNVWYQVSLSDGSTGYIRSDLLNVVEVEEEAPVDEAAEVMPIDAGAPATDTAGIDINSIFTPDGVAPMDMTMATVAVDSGKVRGGASTNDTIVAQLDNGTPLVLAGTIAGADSKTWYYVSFLDGGAQQYGFIRSDLVNPGEVIVIPAPVEEPAPEEIAEAPVDEEPVVNNDYELVYTDDGTGTDVWYLYNHIDNTREKLAELLAFADNQQKVQSENAAQVKTYRIIIIVLAALLVIAITVIVIMLIRSRNEGYGYDYEEDEEDYEEEEEEVELPIRRRGRKAKYEEEEVEEEVIEEPVAPVSRPMQNAAKRRATEGSAPRKPVTYEEEQVAVAPKKTDKKPKNFILDDEDFEFEFLNMDDK